MDGIAEFVAQAASPEERLDARYFETLPTSEETLAARERGFFNSVTNGDEARYIGLLASRGISRCEFRRSLSDVRVRTLPPWAEELAVLLEAFAGEPPPPPQEREGESSADLLLRVGLDTFVRAGRRRVECALGRLAMPVSDDVHVRMTDLVCDRMRTAVGSVLMAALEDRPRNSLAAAIEHVHRKWNRKESWLQLFAEYPVAAKVLATAFANACGFLEELVERLARDAGWIEREIFPGKPLAEFTDFEGAAGDTHEDGRAVSILAFDDGRRLVYKPRDLRIGAWFFRVVRRLQSIEPSLALHERTVLCADGYAWEEYVYVEECASQDEVQLYFERLGMTLRLLQLVEGRDQHYENVRPAGAHPAVVDTETLLQPRHRIGGAPAPHELEVQRRVEESALLVGILPLPIVSEPGRRGVDLGALATPRTVTAPFKVVDLTGRASVYGSIEVGDAAPLLDRRAVDPAEHLDEVQAGYEEMERCLRAHGTRLLDPEMRRAAHELPVRAIHRPTQIYLRLMVASLAPRFLRHGLEWEACLQKLWKGFLRTPEFGCDVYEAEMRAMRGLDVPLFYSRPASDALVLQDGREVPGFFAGTAAERLEARLVRRAAPEADAAIVATALSLHAGAEDRAVPRPSGVASAPSSWLEPVTEIADFILAQAVSHDGEFAWLGLNYQPWADQWTLGVLDSTLLCGTSGLALLFDDLDRVVDEPRYRDAARGCIRAFGRAVARMPEEFAAKRRQLAVGRPSRLFCGLYFGLGGPVLAARRIDPPLFERIRSILPVELLAELAPVDLVSGLAGLVVALDGCAEAAPLREVLIARRQDPPPYPPGTTALDGLPDTQTGIALALGEPVPMEPGTTGRLLAQISTGRATLTPLGDEVSPLDRLELALAAYRATGREEFHERAAAAAVELLDRHRTHGSWFPESRRADVHNLSVIYGLGAVAHALLRLERPNAFDSFRLVGLHPDLKEGRHVRNDPA